MKLPAPLRWWIVAVVGLTVADILSPPYWGICVLHLLMLPLAWRQLHRRFITRVTVAQLIAVVIAGGWRLVQYDIASQPIRLWTILALLAAGYFHIHLRRRLRQRLDHQRSLQQRVRGRSNEVRRVNLALREEVTRRIETEHRLDQSETNFQSLIDRMQLQVARKNAEGVFTYANDQFCSEMGLSPLSVVGSTDADLFHPALAAKYRAGDMNVMATGKIVDKVEEHPGPDGQIGFVQVFKAPEYDAAGNCVGIQVIFWDITEKHRNEIKLRDSEARKRALFEAAGDAVLLVDAKGRIVEVNPSASRLFQAGGGRLIGRPLSDLVMPDSRMQHDEASLQNMQNHQQEKESHSGFAGAKPVTWEQFPLSHRQQVRLRRGDGVSFDSEVSVHQIPVGETAGRAVIIRDITHQRRAFEAMRDAKSAAEQANKTKTQFMAGISHELRTPLGGIRGLTDLLGTITLPATARGYVDLIAQNAELLSDAIEDILDFSAIEAGRVAIDPSPIDLHHVVGDAFSCLAVRAADKPVRLVLSIDPRTPRKVIADAKRIRQIVTNLAGNAIKFTASGEVTLRLHPARADSQTALPQPIPNHSTDANGELASQSPTAELTQLDWEMIEIVVCDTGIGIATEHQERIFAAFEQADRGTNKRFGGTGLGLAISRGLAERMGGGMTVESQIGIGSKFECQLRLPVPSSFASAKHENCKKETSSHGSQDPAGMVVVSVDNESIHKALEETIGHYGWKGLTLEQLGKLKLGHHGRPANGDPSHQGQPLRWILTEATADAAWRIRARKSADRVLWLTRAGVPAPRRVRSDDAVLIEPAHPDDVQSWLNGERVGRSKRRAGRRSRRRIPKASDAIAKIEASGAVQRSQPEFRPLRLLVVDDSATNRLVIHDQLVAAGHDAHTVESGEQAIKAVREQAFDCVLMDLQMPEMDGTEATIAILDEAKANDRDAPPIVALTAHVTNKHRRLCREAGMVGYVTKPVDMDRLIDQLERVTTGDSDEPANQVVESDIPTGESTNDPAAGKDPVADDEHWKERLAKHCGNHPETMASVCEAFTMEVPDLLRQIKFAAKLGDARKLKTAAHTLKSCLRYVAEPDDVQLALLVEKASDDPNWIEMVKENLTSGVPTNSTGTDAETDHPVAQLEALDQLGQEWLDRIRSASVG